MCRDCRKIRLTLFIDFPLLHFLVHGATPLMPADLALATSRTGGLTKGRSGTA
jgi:hypothetical protein